MLFDMLFMVICDLKLFEKVKADTNASNISSSIWYLCWMKFWTEFSMLDETQYSHLHIFIQHVASNIQKFKSPYIYLIIQNSEHNHTDSVAWVDGFQKTPQRENKKMIEKERRERILQQNHKRVKDRRLGWIYRKWMWWILSLYWLKFLI